MDPVDNLIPASQLLKIKEFCKPVTLPDGSTVNGIYDAPSQNVNIGSYGLDASTHQVALADSVALSLVEDDQIYVAAVEFLCTSFEPDGSGLTVVSLKKP